MAHIHQVQIDNIDYLLEPTLFGIATTADSGANYAVALNNFELTNASGVVVQIKFPNTNSASAKLNVNNTGAKTIYYNNEAIAASVLKAQHTYSLVYDGTYWQLIGDIVPSTITPNSHTHGNIQNNGALQTTDIIIGLEDKLIVADASNDGKIARTSVEFDGQTTTKALTKAGTWADVNYYEHPTTSGNKHIPSGGSNDQFLGWDSDGTAKWVNNPNSDTHRPIQINGTQILGNNTTALNLVEGTNISLTNSSGSVTITNSYSLPIAQYNTLGGIKPAYSSTNAAILTTTAAHNTDQVSIQAKSTESDRYYAIEADKDGIAYVNIPWTDHHAWSDITNKPTKITLSGAVTGTVTLGANENTISTTVNHTHNYLTTIAWNHSNKKITQSVNDGTASSILEFIQGSNITLTAESGKITIAGTANDETAQNYSTTSNSYPILLSSIAGITSTSNRGNAATILNNKIYANPSTGTLTAEAFSGSGASLTSLNASNISDGTLSMDRIAAGAIANGKLANSKVTIAGTDVSLGSSISALDLRTALSLNQALRFIGLTTANMTTNTWTGTPAITGNNDYTPTVGDVVINSNTHVEYVCISTTTTPTWERLGADSSWAVSDHTHTISLTDGGTSTISLTANTAYTLTAGGSSITFTTPTDIDTKLRIYLSSTSVELPLVGLNSGDTSAAYASHTSGTKDVYGAIPSTVANRATINPSTGNITAVSFNTLTLTAQTSGFTISGGSTTSKTLTVNNTYILDDACAKAVEDRSSSATTKTITNTGTSLVTERTVYYGLPNFNGAHDYDADTHYYIPTQTGSQYNVLVSTGSTTKTPAWYAGLALSGTATNNYNADFKGTTDASSVDTGAVTIDGGIGIAASMHVGAGAVINATTAKQLVLTNSGGTGGAVSLEFLKHGNAVSSNYMAWQIYMDGNDLYVRNNFNNNNLTSTYTKNIFYFDNATGSANFYGAILPISGGTNTIGASNAPWSNIYSDAFTGGSVSGTSGSFSGLLTISSLAGTANTTYGASLPSSPSNGQIFFQLGEPVFEIPAGGSTGQALIKNSSTDRDVTWGAVGGIMEPVDTGASSNATKKYYVTCSAYSTQNSDPAVFDTDVYVQNTVLFGAAWNDYAEYRQCTTLIEPGRCIVENGDGTLSLSTKRLQSGAEIVSDTFGFAIGKTEKCNTPIAVSGRVLAHSYEPIEKIKIGAPVCSGPDGTVSQMTEYEARKYPWMIIGTISAIPQEDTWGAKNISTKGRIWIRVR